MSKKSITIAIIVIIILAIGAGVWRWQEMRKNEEIKKIEEQKIAEQKKQEEQNNNQQNTEIDTSDWKTYRNEEYGFEFKLPKKTFDSLEVNIVKINYEVGQIDKCVDCVLLRFVVPTKDLNSCPFPRECGKAIMFVIWVRDLKSWNSNNYNKNYACIDSNEVIAKTNKYVYNLCPFNINDKDLNYKPADVQKLLEEVLPVIKNNFKINN